MVRVWRGGQAAISLRGHHAGSGSLSFRIVRSPRHGELSDLRLVGDNRATITYTNDDARPVAPDDFSYVVRASGNQVSSPAEVRILVEEPAAQLRVPGRIDFSEITAGEIATRQLTIRNEGGGVLEGRLTSSSPWFMALPNYRVESDQTETIDVAFCPNEARKFVGQIMLIGADDAQATVLLEGTANDPVGFEPNPLRVGFSKDGVRRDATVALTNQTDRALTLKFETSASFKPIEEITLASKEKRDLSIEVLADPSTAIREAILIVGPGFTAHLQTEAPGLPPNPVTKEDRAIQPPALISATPVPTPVVASRHAPPATAAPTPSPARRSVTDAFVLVGAQRINASRWELRWPRPKDLATKYRIDERLLSLDSNGELRTSWREITPASLTISSDPVTARIEGLNPRQLHMLRVTALDRDGAVRWESPLVALSPARESPTRARFWLMILGTALLVFVVMCWRATRA